MNSLIDGNVRKFVSFEFIIPGYSYMTGYIRKYIVFLSLTKQRIEFSGGRNTGGVPEKPAEGKASENGWTEERK